MYESKGNEFQQAGQPAFKGRALLERYGLRATRQRLGLAKLLFGKGDRHLTADALASEAQVARMPASLATVYNVLNLFAQVGLVRSLAIEGGKTVFDTNTSNHSHFFFEDSGAVCDIGHDCARFAEGVEAPEGYEISKVDVVVRLRPKNGGPSVIARHRQGDQDV
ncbi:ferric uptake regulator, Fur family [Methylocella silvestris BL2]|uniref:Ferric uptake regulation protein n=1 Tax=Methylocella silvestris (strain DSM 15510 / CIP 108128 / LMG 27833 / NCIMB 13906 / BL2) TaxID=395965 RepID=B8EIF7_METSB|nr:Fur family transcriptional regulator [Methylocella silvestris]ACK51276.1 ferric uptake regulator, Fur family [Methylocella silvestris BL2]